MSSTKASRSYRRKGDPNPAPLCYRRKGTPILALAESPLNDPPHSRVPVWWQENDCLTPTFKLKRPQLLKKYQSEVDAMYVSLGQDPAKFK